MTSSNLAREGDGPMSEYRLYTACWKTALAQADENVVIVRTSIGKPRWVPARVTAELPYVKELMPYGLLGKDIPWPDFVKRYTERLDAVGPSVLSEIFSELHSRHGGRPLLLVCFEHRPTECHRGVFARWWFEETGSLIPEWPQMDHGHIAELAHGPAQEQLV